MRKLILGIVLFVTLLSPFIVTGQILFNKNQLTDIDSFIIHPMGSSWGTALEDVSKDTMKLIAVGPSGTGFVKTYLFNLVNDSSFHLISRIDGTMGNLEYSAEARNCLIAINDSVYVAAIVHDHYNELTNQFDTLKSGLIFFNKDGDTLFSRWFGETKRFIVRGFERIDNELFLTGVTKIIGDGTKGFVVKTDLQGNLIWEKLLTQYTMYYCGAMGICKSNSSYLVSGAFNFNSDPLPDSLRFGYTGIYKLDVDGNVIWYKNIFKDKAFGMWKIMNDNTGNYLLIGDTDSVQNVTDYKNNIFISKIDSNANIIWTHIFNEIPKVHKNLWEFRQLVNGNIVYCGERKFEVGSNIHVGIIGLMDSSGNVKWENSFKLNENGGSNSYNHLSYVKQLPDGGFIATGTCKDSITQYQGIWLLRTDSNGCLVPGCFPTSVQVFPDDLMHVSIYPNPTGGNFTIVYSKPLEENCNIRVFDITGKIIYLQSEIAGSFKTQVNLKTAAGIYLLQIIGSSGAGIYTQKIQVE